VRAEAMLLGGVVVVVVFVFVFVFVDVVVGELLALKKGNALNASELK